MSLIFHALWMLCGLGTAVFAAIPTPKRYGTGGFSLGFAVAIAAFRPERLPDPIWVSGFVALAAGMQLLRPGPTGLSMVCSGALAGVWSALLWVQGLPVMLALTLALLLPAVSAYLTARRPAFAPAALREEGLLVVLVLSLAVAAMPTVSAGWRSAIALNLQNESNSAKEMPMFPAWALYLSGASVALGGLYSLWMRR